jgi:Zn finger protein HypA/HybF involved in hydrogenase expression
METERKYFECLSCGRESEIVSAPVKCADCGSGAGVISPNSRAQQRDKSHEAFQRAASIKGKVS